MDKNRDITRIKREEIRRLKEHLTVLQQRLERYATVGRIRPRTGPHEALGLTLPFVMFLKH